MPPVPTDLSRRERQIMDILYRRGRASAAQVMAELDDPPSYSGVRALLRILVQKGHLKHEQDGPRYVYLATLPRERARVGALKQVVQTFFDGSALQAMAALIDTQESKLSKDELERLAKLIDRARKEGR
jgi:BlaI family transcriptional regulator, penicillinase repressor